MSKPKLNAATTAFDADNAWLFAEISLITYRDLDQWTDNLAEFGFKLVAQFNEKVAQALVATNGHATVLAFRGTEFDKPADVIADAKVRLVPGPWGRVHNGLNRALDEIWADVEVALSKDSHAPLFITGHSMGAGMTLMAAARLRDKNRTIQGVYAFGAPRVGNDDFAAEFSEKLGARTWRYVNDEDIIARIPSTKMGYKHVGQLIYFNEAGQRSDQPDDGKSLREHLRQMTSDVESKEPEGMGDHLVPKYVDLVKAEAQRS